MNMKSCTKCGSTVNGFHKRKASKDGYRSLCKLCHNEDSRKWRSVPKNYIVMKIYQSAWNKTPKGIESSRKSSRKLYEQSNGTAQKRYNETEKGKLANRLKASRYNARKNNASICDLTAEEWEAIKKFYYHKCYYSGSGTQCSKGNLEIEHIILVFIVIVRLMRICTGIAADTCGPFLNEAVDFIPVIAHVDIMK